MNETERARAYAEGYADGKRDVAAIFTWEDVDRLRRSAAFLAMGLACEGIVLRNPDLDLADRIAALLPPREQ
jgi:hypothetical protein